jgi:GT2 family glycosyltransferase
MNRAVSIVIPAMGDVELLEFALASLARAQALRRGEDEVLVVDDSGEGLLGPWLMEHFPTVRCIQNSANVGFARALSAGVQAAKHELVFAMNSDVRVRAGFLEPLEVALGAEKVFAAVPRILLDGREGAIESIVELRLENGIARAAQPLLERRAGEAAIGELGAVDCPVPFPIGGAFLFRRSMFQQLGGFDRAFEPFYLEDLDLGWRAWKAGLECRYVASSVVEHHHRGTIGALLPESVVLTSIERNRLLFTWKQLDDPALLEVHVRALARRVAEALVDEDRNFLSALCLALEDRLDAVASAGAETGSNVSTWERIQRACDPRQKR